MATHESRHPFPGIGRATPAEGGDLDAFREALRDAVNEAGQPPGTWLKVDIYVQSQGDPDVGAYKVIVRPI